VIGLVEVLLLALVALRASLRVSNTGVLYSNLE
jgi:hypothetical protein